MSETTTDTAPVVRDRTRANNLPTGHVVVGNVGQATDRELADLAGFGSSHWGYSVTHYAHDNSATVHLHND